MTKLETLKDYLTVKLGLWHGYHRHKENMSNAGFLVQLSLFAAVVTEGIWPPKWVFHITELAALGTFSVYLVLWALLHYYMRWQLINKRIAALYVLGFESSLLHMSTNDISAEDLKISENESHEKNAIRDIIAKVIYVPGGFLKMDASTTGLPQFVASRVQMAFKKGSGGETLEGLMTYASILLMIIVGTKIFFGHAPEQTTMASTLYLSCFFPT